MSGVMPLSSAPNSVPRAVPLGTELELSWAVIGRPTQAQVAWYREFVTHGSAMPQPSAPHGFLSEQDQRLLDREFTIEDPAGIPHLIAKIPPGLPPPTILYKYATKAAGLPRIRCAVCGKALHWKGYVVALADNRRALVAERQCGRDAFGFLWDQVEAGFIADRDRQIDLRRLIALRSVVVALAGELQSGELVNAVSAAGDFRRQLMGSFGKFSQALARMARTEGSLTVTRWVRNREKEEAQARREVPFLVIEVEDAETPLERARARRRLDAWLAARPVREPHEESLGQCLGWRMFVNNESTGHLLDNARRDLEAAMSDFAGQEIAQPSVTVSHVGAACEAIGSMVEQIRQLEEFTRPHNLAAVADWARRDETAQFDLEARGRSLIRRASGAALGVRDDFARPRIQAFDQVLEALRI